MRTGFAHLPLHSGRAPRWLFERMVRLSREILGLMVAEHGTEEVLRRLADPFWFQAFGCLLGFDWHSSGLTTTLCGALKEGVRGMEKDLGFWVCGGKGAVSRKTPVEVERACEQISLSPAPLVYASRMSAKVDSAALQDGYQIYHHTFFFTSRGHWCVVQQGMHAGMAMARRYHWLDATCSSFVCEPHLAICCDQRRAPVLNLVAQEGAENRSLCAELSRQSPSKTLKLLKRLPELKLPRRHQVLLQDINPAYLDRILLKTYEQSPADFEQLLSLPGVGAKTLRALALTAELVYGAPASTRDPARFSFAHGGKDGTPYPVDRVTYDQTIELLRETLNKTSLEGSEKTRAFRRLARLQMRSDQA